MMGIDIDAILDTDTEQHQYQNHGTDIPPKVLDVYKRQDMDELDDELQMEEGNTASGEGGDELYEHWKVRCV